MIVRNSWQLWPVFATDDFGRPFHRDVDMRFTCEYNWPASIHLTFGEGWRSSFAKESFVVRYCYYKARAKEMSSVLFKTIRKLFETIRRMGCRGNLSSALSFAVGFYAIVWIRSDNDTDEDSCWAFGLMADVRSRLPDCFGGPNFVYFRTSVMRLSKLLCKMERVVISKNRQNRR
jgi:hypothetical protein